MVRTPIKKIGDLICLVLTDDILKQLDLCIEDEVEITIANHRLIITPLSEQERKQKIDEAIERTFKRRESAYQRLAKGG